MSAVGDNNGSDNHGSDESTGGDLPRGWHKGKKRQNSAKCQVQELEEAEEAERQAVEARALAEAALSPEEREERRRVEEADSLALCQQRPLEYEVETKRQIAEAKKSVARAEALRRLISAGKAMDHDKAETVELLGRGESPDANDVPDENLDSDDESTDPDAGPKMVEGTKKRKRGSTKGKNARIPEDKLVWGFHPEGACQNCHDHGEECLVAKNAPYQACFGCKKKKIGCPFVTRAVQNVRKNAAASGSKRLGRAGGSARLEWAEDDVVLPAGRRTRLDDVCADVSALTGRIRELEAFEELARELLILTSRALLANDPSLSAAQRYLLNVEDRQRAEVPVEGGSRVVKKRKRVVVLMELKRPRNQSTSASQRLASVLTPKPEEDADGEMDVDGAEGIRPEENDPEENRPEEDHPETSHLSHIQEWLAGLEPADIAQSEDAGDMELDGPGEFGPFLQLAPDLILVPIAEEPKLKEEEQSEAEMLARSAGRKEEKAREEELARVEAQMAELQSKRNALAATKAVKLELLPVELPAQAQLLEDALSGFRAGLRPDGQVEFVLDDDDEEPVASGSGTRPDPETKED
ncbi:hypothetical protein DFH08DRAFT_975190 [Mycena albidolilacea]|uniref:Uncharacterized protein n=1 Tax=Mycena albidolilacea TaxID=1033008 RepID=A0AAD6Z5R7_9AGAR|nr:hypothetical protein DFH08DRAFT_975190 [Mycena albidolilacea]